MKILLLTVLAIVHALGVAVPASRASANGLPPLRCGEHSPCSPGGAPILTYHGVADLPLSADPRRLMVPPKGWAPRLRHCGRRL
jgi:hypothetical protein